MGVDSFLDNFFATGIFINDIELVKEGFDDDFCQKDTGSEVRGVADEEEFE